MLASAGHTLGERQGAADVGMCVRMLEWAKEATQHLGDTDMLELYCGNGNFTVALAENFRLVSFGAALTPTACLLGHDQGIRLGLEHEADQTSCVAQYIHLCFNTECLIGYIWRCALECRSY